MSKLILVERLPNGFYRASRGDDWQEWAPLDGPGHAHGQASKAFRRELRYLDLGLGCEKCSYLEAEHNIDGPEKAPCDGFAAPPEETGR